MKVNGTYNNTVYFSPIKSSGKQNQIKTNFKGKENRQSIQENLDARAYYLITGLQNSQLSKQTKLALKGLIPQGKEIMQEYYLAAKQNSNTDEHYFQILDDVAQYQPEFFKPDFFSYESFAQRLAQYTSMHTKSEKDFAATRKLMATVMENKEINPDVKRKWLWVLAVGSQKRKEEFEQNYQMYANDINGENGTKALLWLKNIPKDTQDRVLNAIQNSAISPQTCNTMILKLTDELHKKEFIELADIIQDDLSLWKYVENIIKLTNCFDFAEIREGITCKYRGTNDARKEAIAILAAKQAQEASLPIVFNGVTGKFGIGEFLEKIDNENIAQVRELAEDDKCDSQAEDETCNFWAAYNFIKSCSDKDSKTPRFKLYPGQKEAVIGQISDCSVYNGGESEVLPAISQSCVVKNDNGEYYFDRERFEKGMLVFWATSELNQHKIYDISNYVIELCKSDFDFENNKSLCNSRLKDICTKIKERIEFEARVMNYTGNQPLADELINQARYGNICNIFLKTAKLYE